MFAALLQYDDTTDLLRITAPTLLVWGEIDALVCRGVQDQLVRTIPTTRAGRLPRSRAHTALG